VSCERLFNPALLHEPTVVLTNNDGGAIARSQEAKNLGVKKGQQLFELEEEKQKRIHKFSSNYALYGDISDRITRVLKDHCSLVEVYSIDESFLDLSHLDEDELLDFMKMLKSEIQRLVGIPVSIGVAPTKTLAKLCNMKAKKDDSLKGVCSFFDNPSIADNVEVGEIWGIGSKGQEKLKGFGVEKVSQMKLMSPSIVKASLTITGLRTWHELHGTSMIPVTTFFKKPRHISSSRTFGKETWDKEGVKEALCNFLGDALKKAAEVGMKPRSISFFVSTNRFKDNYYIQGKSITLETPTLEIHSLWNEISIHMEFPFRKYHRAGIFLFDLVDSKCEILRMFQTKFEESPVPETKEKNWKTRREFLSPEYTTSWDQLPKLSK
jgi:DNA polymerase V